MSKESKSSKDLSIEYVSPESLRPYPGNARVHNRRQRRALEASMKRFGYTNPALITADGEIIAGHGRVEAAKTLGLTTIPVIRIEHLSESERRAYILADNQLALKAGWDREILAVELQGLLDVGFDFEEIGFDAPELDFILDSDAEKKSDSDTDDLLPKGRNGGTTISRTGDIWPLGSNLKSQHRIVCGDSRGPSVIRSLMDGLKASTMISDTPYNVHIHGHASGKGKAKHPEFMVASGELQESEFITFLRDFLSAALTHMTSGALLYVFMDWRHIYELLSASRSLDLAPVNLCVWNKTNGGMGSLYRSKHELVFVFRSGSEPHRNNVELGKNGRSRTNVWDYAGVNAFRAERNADLAMHPTVKPVAMIADAIRDVTQRGDIILDQFCGSGTTIIAAEKTGRRARAVEVDPHYCDVAVLRWQAYTGKRAVLLQTGETFEELAEKRKNDYRPASSSECNKGAV